MTQIVSHVAVVCGEGALRARWVEGLERVGAMEPVNPELGVFRFLPLADAAAVLQLAREDGLLQAAIIDTGSLNEVGQLVRDLKQLRPELDLFVGVESGVEPPAQLPVRPSGSSKAQSSTTQSKMPLSSTASIGEATPPGLVRPWRLSRLSTMVMAK